MTKKANVRTTVVYRPKVRFTHQVTRKDRTKVHQEPTAFGASEIQSVVYTQEHGESTLTRRAQITLNPANTKRWTYHQTLEVYTGQAWDRGRCVRADWINGDRLMIEWHDFSWDFNSILVRHCATINMKGLEQAYWLIRLMQDGREPKVEGFSPNTTRRVFRYAVPLLGIANDDTDKLVGQSDFGLTSDRSTDPVNELIGKLTQDIDDASWNVRVPKVYGAVVASTPLEAEMHALRRARFAADLITFALQTGASHFDTVHKGEALSWDAIETIKPVSTRPWLLLFEEKTLKGWVRSVPLTTIERSARIAAVKKRLRTFFTNFQEVAECGDVLEQLNPDSRGPRENKIGRAVQTAMRWLTEAARMPDDDYRLVPVWTALEAILGAIAYPPIFTKEREHIKRNLAAAIDEIKTGSDDADEVATLKDMLRGRLGDNNWPIRKRVGFFAREFGIALQKGDFEVIKSLGRVRNRAIHTGDIHEGDLNCEVGQLKYLVERLILAASVCGVRAKVKGGPHKIKIVGIEPGTTGAATIYINGKEVSYVMTMREKTDGTLAMVITSDGLIYDDTNSVIE